MCSECVSTVVVFQKYIYLELSIERNIISVYLQLTPECLLIFQLEICAVSVNALKDCFLFMH